MKNILVIFLLSLCNFAFAGNGPFLLGGMIGDPTGISGKLELGKGASVDGGLSYSLGSRSGAQLHGDYLVTKKGVIVAGDSDLDLYYGAGLRMITLNSGDDKGKLSFGPRAPIGLSHEIKDPSVEFFGEIALILDLSPSTAADLDLSLGVRYRF